MPKQLTSQWDFGELLPAAATRRVFTVSELTGQIKRLLEQQLGLVWVSGEVTNLRLQPSGHTYFTLKDAAAQLSCVLFRDEARGSRELLADGQQVLAQGELTVYEPRGQYQLRVCALELHGVGALQLAFARLKQRLSAEGLFAPERKRPLPPYPRRVGLVTSPAGAALRDVLHVVQRRNPALELLLAPCRVQGQGAADEIAAAIHLLNQWHQAGAADPRRKLDLILLTRGGGSLEDLWPFNEEVVARAIFRSALPVLSAVGHEIDFTISDFVADLRAATPSAAAELITEGAVASRRFLAGALQRLRHLARQARQRHQERARQLLQRLGRAHPRRRLNENWQRLDDLLAALRRQARLCLREAKGRWLPLWARWGRCRPSQTLAQRRDSLAASRRRLVDCARFQFQLQQNRWSALDARWRALSPELVLARGYSITMDAATGRVLRAAAETQPGQVLNTRLRLGQVRSIVA
jgi:exodeoxyribonuclease VII large subunit